MQRALRRGTRGYLLKSASTELLDAVRLVHAGENKYHDVAANLTDTWPMEDADQ